MAAEVCNQLFRQDGIEFKMSFSVRYTTDGDFGHVSLIIGKCRAGDEGDYTLTVKNPHGTDSVDAK